MAYDVGDRVRLTHTFTNADGANTDPTTIVFKFKTPAGVTTTYTYGVNAELTKVSTGVYRVFISLSAAGIWRYRIEGTGVLEAANEDAIHVNRSFF